MEDLEGEVASMSHVMTLHTHRVEQLEVIHLTLAFMMYNVKLSKGAHLCTSHNVGIANPSTIAECQTQQQSAFTIMKK